MSWTPSMPWRPNNPHASKLERVSIGGCLSVRPRALLEADPCREHFSFFPWHFGGYDR